jgi:hypothetical protein
LLWQLVIAIRPRESLPALPRLTHISSWPASLLLWIVQVMLKIQDISQPGDPAQL